MTQIVES